jgi:hypothetical protein
MATLATMIRNFEQPRRAEIARSNPYLLRALPNEDIYLHVKRIDNSRLVREPDPKSRQECWSAIGAACALAAALLTSLAPRVAGITAGYQLEALKQDHQRLLAERRTLEVEEAALLRPERLEQLAKDQHLGSPKADQIVHLNLDASAGTVALNVSKKVK